MRPIMVLDKTKQTTEAAAIKAPVGKQKSFIDFYNYFALQDAKIHHMGALMGAKSDVTA